MRFLVCLALLAAPAAALAQITDPADPVALLRHGVELRRQGHDEEAAREFARAYELSHTANAAGQLGLAEQALGRWVDAERHVREAMADTTDRWVSRNRAALQAAYAVIQTHVGMLEVRGEPAGAEVFVEGVVVGTLPLSEPAHALVGSVRLEVRAEGREPISRRVEILAGQLTREEVSMSIVTIVPQQSVTTPNPATAPSASIGFPHALIGVGALGIIGGGFAWIMSAVTIPRPACDGVVPLVCDESARSAVSTAQAWSVASVVAGPIGLVALGVGAALLVRRTPERRSAWMVVPLDRGAIGSMVVRF